MVHYLKPMITILHHHSPSRTPIFTTLHQHSLFYPNVHHCTQVLTILHRDSQFDSRVHHCTPLITILCRLSHHHTRQYFPSKTSVCHLAPTFITLHQPSSFCTILHHTHQCSPPHTDLLCIRNVSVCWYLAYIDCLQSCIGALNAVSSY